MSDFILLLRRLILVGTEFEELIFKNAHHALDLLQSLAVAVWGGKAGGSQQTQLFVDVTQLPV